MGPVVRDADGNVMLRLHWADDTAMPRTRSLVSLLFAFAAIACATTALWLLALSLSSAWAALLVFLPVLIGTRIATLAHGSFETLTNYALFDPSLFASSFFMPSLGDLLINAVVLLCAATFVRRALRRIETPGRHPPGARLFAECPIPHGLRPFQPSSPNIFSTLSACALLYA